MTIDAWARFALPTLLAEPIGACRPTRRLAARKLLPRFETALRACARFLHDLVRVYRAPQLGDAFDARARGALGGNAGGCHGCADFVGFAPGQRAFARSEVEFAAARRDIDIADAADHGLRIDGNFRIGGEAESGVAAEEARDDPLVERAHRGRMLRDHRRQGQAARPARATGRSRRGALHDGERQGGNQGGNNEILHRCSLRSEPSALCDLAPTVLDYAASTNERALGRVLIKSRLVIATGAM